MKKIMKLDLFFLNAITAILNELEIATKADSNNYRIEAYRELIPILQVHLSNFKRHLRKAHKDAIKEYLEK